MQRSSLFTISAALHVGVALALGALHVHKAHQATAIEFADSKPKKPEPPKPPETPPKPKLEPPPRRALARSVAAPAAAPGPARPPSFSDVPDFGLALEGASEFGGIPVPLRGPLEEVARDTAPKPAAVVAPSLKSGCRQTASKPKPLTVPPPEYPDAARAANLSGRVRVQLIVDENGNVVDVVLIQPLGHGFDEAAIAAARRARFEPAKECGKATRGTFTIAMRFSAG